MHIWKQHLASNVFSEYAKFAGFTCVVPPSSPESLSFPVGEFVSLTASHSSFMDWPFSPCWVCGPSELRAKSTSLQEVATKCIFVPQSRESEKIGNEMGMVSFSASVRGSIHSLELDSVIHVGPLLRIFWEDVSG